MTTDFYLDGYAAKTCTYALHLAQVESPGVRIAPSDVALHRMDSGNLFEDAVGEYLTDIAPQHCLVSFLRDCDRSVDEEVWSKDRANRLADTIAAMKEQTPVIWNPRLPPDPIGHKSGEPDLIIALHGEINGGCYVPVDVKAHHALSPRARLDGSVTLETLFAVKRDAIVLQAPDLSAHKEDLLQLAHYWRMLEAQGFAPEGNPFGAVIGSPAYADDLASLTWFDLTDVMAAYDDAFGDALHVVQRGRDIASGADEGPLGVPWYSATCNDCGWRAVCGPRMLERHDVSLVRPSRHIVNELDDFSITTIADLANVKRSLLRRNGEAIADSSSWRESIRRAQLAVAGDPIPFSLLPELEQEKRPPRLWRRPRVSKSLWELPGGDVELDVDMECTTSHVYLWGTLLTYRTSTTLDRWTPGYRGFGDSFPTDIEQAEGEVFLSFWNFMQAVIKDCEDKQLSFRAYCYSDAENRWMRRCADLIDGIWGESGEGSLRAQGDEFIASPMWVDLLREMKLRAESLSGLGLKNVAKALGFTWRSKDAGGEASMLWYQYATTNEDLASRAAWGKQILEYNEDDVRATRHLRDWFASHDVEDLSVVPE